MIRRFSIDSVFLFLSTFYVWKGTRPETLFSRNKLIAISFLALLEITLGIFTVVQFNYASYLRNWSYEPEDHNIIFLFMMGELCNLYIYTKYLFFGLTKVKLHLDGENEVIYEKIVEEPSRAKTILP